MHINHRLKLVFCRVPKTASTSFMRAIGHWDLTPQVAAGKHTHAMFREMTDKFIEEYRDYRWVGMVRNPHDWVPSLYSWIHNNHPRMKQTVFGSTEVPHNWVEFLQALKATPMDWLSDPRVQDRIEVFRMEDIPLIEASFDIKMPHQNRTAKPREFNPTLHEDALVQQIFHRELSFYK